MYVSSVVDKDWQWDNFNQIYFQCAEDGTDCVALACETLRSHESAAPVLVFAIVDNHYMASAVQFWHRDDKDKEILPGSIL